MQIQFKVRLLFACIFILSAFTTNAQLLDSLSLAEKKEYTSLEEAMQEPEKVYRLNLQKKRLKYFPAEVMDLPNLQWLDLSRNKIDSLPPYIDELTQLTYFNVSRNRLTVLPTEIGKMTNLRYLIANMNRLDSLPPEIGQLTNMTLLDLWGNNIVKLPPEIANLKESLKTMDMRVIHMGTRKMDAMEKLLPKTVIFFSHGCDCD